MMKIEGLLDDIIPESEREKSDESIIILKSMVFDQLMNDKDVEKKIEKIVKEMTQEAADFKR